MSIQTDCELLMIMAIESYAKKHGMTTELVARLFKDKQIYEKITVQHEYLHQVSFDEVEEFIEKEVNENSDELIVYHGTCSEFEKIDLSKSHNKRDFGKGFYTTLLENQSKEWGYRLSLREKKDRYYTYVYQFVITPDLKIKRFDSLNEEWLEFIKENRIKGDICHSYDVVIGAVADDNTMETVQLYISGILTAEEAISRLRYFKANNQISFHTSNAVSHLKLIRRDEYANDLHI